MTSASSPAPSRARRAAGAKPDRTSSDDGPLSSSDLVEIERALAQHDRSALRRFWTKVSAAAVPQREMKWVCRLAFAAGEFERAGIALAALLSAGELEFADACLLLQTRHIVGVDLEPESIFALVVPDRSIDLPPQQLALLADAADALFLSGAISQAIPLFDYLSEQAEGHHLFDPIRFGEALISVRRFDRALDVLRCADIESPLPSEALCLLADAAIEVGELDMAEEVFGRLRDLEHESLYSLSRKFDLLLKRSQFDGAAELLTEVSGRVPAEFSARLSLLLALARRDLDQVLAIAPGVPPEIMRALGSRLAEFGYAILNAGPEGAVEQFEAMLQTHGEDSPGLMQLRIDLAFRRMDFATAAQTIERAQRSVDEVQAPLFRLKQAELHAFRGEPDQAIEAIDAMGPLQSLPKAHLSPIATMLAEAKAWPRLLALASARLDEWFVFDSHGVAMLAAAAAEEAWNELIESIDRKGGERPSLELRKLRLAALERQADRSDLHRILETSDLVGLEGYADRLRAKIEATSLGSSSTSPQLRRAAERELTVFYCTDANYLAPALNSINSLLLSNVPFTGDLAIHLFVEEQDVALAEAAAAALRDRFACTLTVTSSRVLLGDFDGALRTSYGLFTGGWELSKAAYYRIFATKYLLTAAPRRRALYIDADTLVTGDISRIVAVLDGTAPLAARAENDKFAVRHVETLHGLPRGSFFNSGVLLFDMAHPELIRRLDDTISQVRDHSEHLVYHDQCALNRGFRDAVAPLPDQYNSFCTNRDGLSARGATGIILHFLDRPKPWQPGYSGPFGVFWYRYWHEFAKVVGAEVTEQLMSTSTV